MPRREEGRVTEVAAPSPITTRVSSLTRDTTNVTLSLIRVQSSATAARGRGLVNFLTDLTSATDNEPVIVVIQCERCPQFYHPRVHFDPKGDTVTHLPDNCRRCGHPLDRPDVIRDVIATAHHLAEGIRVGGLAS